MHALKTGAKQSIIRSTSCPLYRSIYKEFIGSEFVHFGFFFEFI